MRDKKNFFVFVFLMLVLQVEYIFLTTFYGLYFNHQLHITITLSLSSYFLFMRLLLLHSAWKHFIFCLSLEKNGTLWFFPTFRRDFQQIPLSVNNLQNVDNHNSFNFTIPNKPLLKFYKKFSQFLKMFFTGLVFL